MNNLSKPANSNLPEAKPLILIVEDDLNYLKVLEENFQTRGFPVHSVTNPIKALNQIKKSNPDVILINIQMRLLSSERVIKVLRTHEINTPIFVYTEKISKDMIIDLKGYDIKGFFVKPIEFEKIEAKIYSVLESNGKSSVKKPVTPDSDSRKKQSPSVLIFSEFQDIAQDPYMSVPRSFFIKHGYRIIIHTSYHSFIEALKKQKNNIQIILVNATNEAHTKTIAKLLKIIVSKHKIPVYYIADGFSQALQNSLNEQGFVNLLSLQETSQKDILIVFSNLLKKTHTSNQFDTSQQRVAILKGLKLIKTLPPMPDIYNKVEKLARDPNSTSNDFGKVLEFDTDITARLLRMSNSAFFSFKRQIRSVKDAVSLMGIKEIISLVRLSCITGNLKVSPKIESDVKKIWEHSATCAITAKLIYSKTDITKEKVDEDNLFTAGIIHDIGKIIFWKFFPDIYSSFLHNPKVGAHPCEAEEKKYMGITHGEIGNAIAEHWKLPESLSNVIAYHHKPTLKPEYEILKIIYLADIVSNITMKNIKEDQDICLDPEFEKIGYNDEKVRSLANDLEPAIREKHNLVMQMIIK